MLDTKTTAKLACCVAIALGTTALAAQQTTIQETRKPGDLKGIRKVSTLIGVNVVNHTNTKVAVLRNLAFARDGAALYAILGWGGVAGVGESFTAVPFDMLGVRHDDGKWAVNLDMTTKDLNKAPIIKAENYRELWDPQWIARMDRFVRVRGESVHHPERTAEVQQREHRIVDRVLLATKIRAATLKNQQNQELGKVEDLLLDPTDHVVFVIVARGGVLGVNESYVPIPWEKLGLGENRENAAVSIAIDATKPQIEKAPVVKGDNYATLLAPGFANQVREYYGVPRHAAAASRETKTTGK